MAVAIVPVLSWNATVPAGVGIFCWPTMIVFETGSQMETVPPHTASEKMAAVMVTGEPTTG